MIIIGLYLYYPVNSIIVQKNNLILKEYISVKAYNMYKKTTMTTESF
jgi:hypothetical protein